MSRSYKVSKAGLEKAKKAFEIKGWTQEYLAGRTNCTRQVVSKFFGRGSVEKRFFQAICTELLLDWGEIADLDSEEKEDIKPSDRNMKHALQTAPMVLQERDEVIQQSNYPESTTQGQKRLGYAIVGSVDKVDVQKLKTIVALLQSITGDTSIEIVGIEEGSIRLILEGSQESLEQIKSLFQSGELTEVSEIPIVDIQFLPTTNLSKKRLAFTIASNISEVDMQRLRNAFIKENISQAPINQNFITYSDNSGYRMNSERTISTGGGNYNEVIQGSYIQGNYYAAGQPQSLVQAAAEIQALLKQLESNYPSNTPARDMVVATEVLKHLESSPTMKRRVINAVKEGGLAAFEKAIDNPAGAFIIGAVKGWQEVKDY